MQRFVKHVLAGGLILILAALYWYGGVQQLARVNTDMKSTDQSAYMDYARNMYESDYTFIGGRNRMPVYPFLQSLFYHPSLSNEGFFERGKYVNLILSLVLLAGLASVFRHFFGPLHALNLVLIIAFTVFIFKAGWFQTELLFYVMNFCLFLLMCRLLQEPSCAFAILTGIVAALAHLTKASVLPGLVVFLLSVGAQGAWTVCGNRRTAARLTTTKSTTSHFTVILLVGLFFLITVFPYISTSKRVFGHYFYNVNSTFYMWYDSWEEAKQGTRAYGDRVGWPEMPPEEIPSMSKYLREHTPKQTMERFLNGGRLVWNNVLDSYGYFKYIVIYACSLIVAMRRHWTRTRQFIAKNPILCVFLLIYFATYGLLYSWYAPIIAGNRLILAQFIPLMFVISSGLCLLLRSSQVKVGRHLLDELAAMNLVITVIVSVDIYFILSERVGTMYGGR